MSEPKELLRHFPSNLLIVQLGKLMPRESQWLTQGHSKLMVESGKECLIFDAWDLCWLISQNMEYGSQLWYNVKLRGSIELSSTDHSLKSDLSARASGKRLDQKNTKWPASREVSASHHNGMNSLNFVGFIPKETDTKAYSWGILTKSVRVKGLTRTHHRRKQPKDTGVIRGQKHQREQSAVKSSTKQPSTSPGVLWTMLRRKMMDF